MDVQDESCDGGHDSDSARDEHSDMWLMLRGTAASVTTHQSIIGSGVCVFSDRFTDNLPRRTACVNLHVETASYFQGQIGFFGKTVINQSLHLHLLKPKLTLSS